MKKFPVLLLSIAFYCFGCSKEFKEEDVPENVKATFHSLYPEVKHAEWTKENDSYEAEFEQNGVEIEVSIDAMGNLIQTEIEITVSSLPQAVLDYISKNYSGKNIKEASKIIAANGTVTYEIEVGNSEYLFDAAGNFIRSETDDKDEEDDDD